MKRNALIVLLMVVGFHYGISNDFGVERWHLAGGLVFPAAPDQFYDYWKQGYQIVGGVEFSSQSRFVQVISAEVDYFPFDQSRFLKRLGITTGQTNIRGSNAINLSLSYLIKYPFTEYEHFQPAIFAGIGCLSCLRTSASLQYTDYSVLQGSSNSVVASIPFGLSVRLLEGAASALDVNFAYTYGLTKRQTINSNYTSVRLDYSF